ncbi:hypothetical protein AAG906_038373 [Vitis piasezkii]
MALIVSKYVEVYGAEKLQEALLHRPKNNNHVASMDDPLVNASLLPPSSLLNAQSLRWTMCATDRCFKNPVTYAFFRCVKVLPVSLGDGIYQKGMDMVVSKLNSGGRVIILGCGWHEFYESNKLKVGDACFFELNPILLESPNHVLDVQTLLPQK